MKSSKYDIFHFPFLWKVFKCTVLYFVCVSAAYYNLVTLDVQETVLPYNPNGKCAVPHNVK